MKQDKLNLRYGIDFLYLIGGLIVLCVGIYFAYFGLGPIGDGHQLIEKILLSSAFIISGFFYLRYAFHFNYPNNYVRASLLLILSSLFPYLNFSSISFDNNVNNINTFMLSVLSVFGAFIFLVVSGLLFLFIGYMKGRTDLENESTQPVKIK